MVKESESHWSSRLLDAAWQDLTTLSDRLLDQHLIIGITGLRHAGKTVFLATLIERLLQAEQALPGWTLVTNAQYLAARCELLPDTSIAAFPWEEMTRSLKTSSPTWPSPTDSVSGVRVTIRYRTESAILRQVTPERTLILDLIDYPGEWLLDLPMMQMSYAEWSKASLERLEPEAVRTMRDQYLRSCEQVSGGSYEERRSTLAEQWRQTVRKLADEAQLSHLQPGRALMPGQMTGDAALDLAPLPDTADAELITAMNDAYDLYVKEVVTPFFETIFSRFDRQLVLIDVLTALNAGQVVFDDRMRSLADVLQSFRYGKGSLLTRLFAPKIDRVLFAASKVDHVSANQHPNLRRLLELMVQSPAREARFEGVTTGFMALTALRSTETVRKTHDGQSLSCVKGRLRDEDRETVLFPGEIPEALPTAEDWAEDRFRFKPFAPKPFRPETNDHLRVDEALDFLMGDRLW